MAISDILSLTAIIISVFSIFYIREHDDNIRFLNMFNEIYRKTFKLRVEMNEITNKYWGIPFYYEYDSIYSLDELEEKILDYLTDLENFFSFVRGKFLSKRSLRTLVSYAFYQRVSSLYSYILKKRMQTNNPIMFKNYIITVRKMKKMRKIKYQCPNVKNAYYVGIRESDIAYAKAHFKKAICLFGNTPDSEPFSIRHNQNINHREILPFYVDTLRKICTQNPNASIYFYNQRTAYNYDEDIRKNCKCINPKELLDFINNKLSIKEWFVKNSIPVIQYATFMGSELLFSKLCTHFKGYKSFVIQVSHGGGGIGTFYVNQFNFSKISDKVEPLQRYIVSPYIPNVSANVHIFIAEKQTVLSPASIQIIEQRAQQLCYRGGDFCAFQKLSAAVKDKIKKLGFKVADLLRKLGYRGIAGVDFIIDSAENVYCCEINPRFQASTFILDRYLKECSIDKLTAKSCFELNEMAFSGNMITTLCFEDKINYSCYFYYCDGNNIKYFREKYKLLEKNAHVDVFEDGINYYLNQEKINDDSYLFRAIFPHAISEITPDMTLWVNDNVQVSSKPEFDMACKIALLNQGVRIEGQIPDMKTGVYKSIDICITSSNCIKEGLNINCAYGIHLSQYSPYLIKLSSKAEELYYYGEKIADIKVERDCLTNLSDLDKKILYVATDRLRIKIVSGCENKNAGKGCAFCNVPISKCRFSIIQIQQALQNLKKENISFRHILVGGGSCLAQDSWDEIIELCQYLKGDDYYKNKPISIMTMLPPKNRLVDLKNAGIEEVAFNIEISDDSLAYKYMPAKRLQNKDAYYDVLRESVHIFGQGNVRSALLVGLDREDSIYNEVATLADMGVLPCLSAFRALPGTCFENTLGPSNTYLLKVYNNVTQILKSMPGEIRELGPKCQKCRNNMLTL